MQILTRVHIALVMCQAEVGERYACLLANQNIIIELVAKSLIKACIIKHLARLDTV